MALSASVRTKRDTTITFSDSGAANSLTVVYEPGDFSYTAAGYAIERYLDRTEHMRPRKGDAQTTTVTFSTHVTTFYSTSEATVPDICEVYSRASGYVATTWTSTLNNLSDATSFDLDVVIDGDYVGEADVTLHFDDMQFNGSFSEGAPSTYTVNGEASILGPVVS